VEDQKVPGIAIEHVRLLNAHIEMVNSTVEGKPSYNVRLIGMQRVESHDGMVLDLLAQFDVMHGVEKPLFKFTCDFVARYRRRAADSMTWEEFSSGMALAHIIPYLREFVSNMTNRLPAPVLMLDPINAHAMIDDYKKRKVAVESRPADKG
jgi:preprotein translocase subunit SecB